MKRLFLILLFTMGYWGFSQGYPQMDTYTLVPTNAPTSPLEGQTYYDQTSKKVFVWDGTQWLDLSETTVDNSLSEANQDIGSNDRVIDMDPSGSLAITRGQETFASFDGDGTVILNLLSDPYDMSWDGSLQPATKDDIYDKIESLNVIGQMGEALTTKEITASPYTPITSDIGKLLTWDGGSTLVVEALPTMTDGQSISFQAKNAQEIEFNFNPVDDSNYYKTANQYAAVQWVYHAAHSGILPIGDLTPYTPLTGTLLNAADPIQEVGGTANTASADGEISWSSQDTNVQNGMYALRATKTGGGDNDASSGEITLAGITNGQNVTVTVYIDESSTVGTTWAVDLDENHGWVNDETELIGNTGYNVYVMTNTADQDNPILRLRTTSVGDVGDIADIDNISWVVN
ncbi:MAG: hypothetical protein AAF634_10095 [Bacteroidota bacterium]